MSSDSSPMFHSALSTHGLETAVSSEHGAILEARMSRVADEEPGWRRGLLPEQASAGDGSAVVLETQ